MNPETKIYTIIVTYNPLKWIDKCLACLAESSVSTEIVVVDNCSTDGAREYLPSKYQDLIWLPQDHNLGFGQANNLGIRYALEHGADYVFLLNQDAYVYTDTIKELLSESDGKSVLSPIHLNGSGSRLDDMFRIALSMTDLTILDDMLVNGTPAGGYRVQDVSAACWMIPCAVLDTIGGFNPVFFQYGEDNNYCQRLHYHGIELKVVTAARVCHDRKVHGNITVFNSNKLWRDIILIECDINKGARSRFVQFFKLLKRLYCKDLVRGMYRPFAFTANIFKLWCGYAKIRYSRRMDKSIGRTWL